MFGKGDEGYLHKYRGARRRTVMPRKSILEEVTAFAKRKCEGAESGHDWWHINRVCKNAIQIIANEEQEKFNVFVVTIGALLHEMADPKLHFGGTESGIKEVRGLLVSAGVLEEEISQVENIIRHVSFSVLPEAHFYMSPELAVVQDADRLDALGAIGIARVFNYGGHIGRAIHDPDAKPRTEVTLEEYCKRTGTTINHFYEKLLLLKDRMNTVMGKKLAEQRHEFMVQYLEQFRREWDGGWWD